MAFTDGFFYTNKKMKQYPEKILVAWGEAISGNAEIRDWLMKNGYPELGLFVFALYFDKKASDWLMKHAPHLLATVKAVEGKKDARAWLQKGYPLLHQVALAADDDKEAMRNLVIHDRIMAVIAQKIKSVKDDIEEANNDVHRWGYE